MAEWLPIKATELQQGTRFRMKGKKAEYVVTGPISKDGDHYVIPTSLGTGRMRTDAELEYRSAFA